MAKILLNVPKNKIQTLLSALLPLGINIDSILKLGSKQTIAGKPLKKRASRFLLNWEFFSNELEYE